MFYEARKIVEEQLTAPGKSYASITKGAGVRCTDAQTQTDVTYDMQLTFTASGDGPTPKSGQNAGFGRPPAPQTSAGGGTRPAQKPSSIFEKNKVRVGPGAVTKTMHQKRKSILTEYRRDQMIPLNHITYMMP